MQDKILEGDLAATTLGDALVGLQLLCFGSFLAQGLGLLGSIESLYKLLWFPHLPSTYMVHHFPTQSNTIKNST